MFTKGFGYTYDGAPALTCEVDGYELRAWTERDDDGDAPDLCDEGFWPSDDPNDAGYIGRKSKRTLARHHAKAEEIMRAWRDDEWDYCGVCVSVSRVGVELCQGYEAALWGCERNHPLDKDNDQLLEVANQLIPEALVVAKRRALALFSSVVMAA